MRAKIDAKKIREKSKLLPGNTHPKANPGGLEKLRGILKSPLKHPVSVRQMDRAIMDAVAEDDQRIRSEYAVRKRSGAR